MSCTVTRAAEPHRIDISTAHSTLSLMVGPDGRLYELGYGSSNKKFEPPAKGFDRLDEFYPASGDGFIDEPALQVTHADGNTSTDLIYVGDQTKSIDSNVSVTTIQLKDPAYPFNVTLVLKTYRDQDIIEFSSQIKHSEDGPVTLYRFASAAPVMRGHDYWLTQFSGDYKREATLAEEKLTPGIKMLDSKIGVRATRFCIPSCIIALDDPASEESGEVFGGSLKWSGSFQLAFQIDSKSRLRTLAGINPFGSHYRMSGGETFTTPAMLWTYSDQGKGQMSRNFHRWARSYGIRDGGKPRPVLMNNWEATHMDFDEARIVSMFDAAKELGIELFLLDDGWFGNKHPRDGDNAGLGDWQPNHKKLPHGLSYLADEAEKRGIGFGIWIEPEMVNPASELYEKHPDWAIQQPHRELEFSRNQLDLDLTNPRVQEYVWKCVDQTLSNPGISYVKWDANRYITQPGSTYLKHDEQSHLMIDYVRALYDVMDKMQKKFPNVMAMECAGGGGRADYGAMQYFDGFWPSDNTDPAKRVFIQWGFSHFFPACTISAHVTRMGKRPMKFTIDVALSGALGVDMDPSKLSEQDKHAIAAGVALYKQRIRPIVLGGDLYRLESPYDHPRSAIDYVLPDQSRAVVFVYQLKDAPSTPVKPRGLDPQRQYRVQEVNLPAGESSRLPQDGKTIDGATLMRDGLLPPCDKQYTSSVIELDAVQ